MSDDTRTEKDPLGSLQVPADALYGVQTLRAVQNFPISGLKPLAAFVDATVRIKRAAALTHKQTGRLEAKLADAIVKAADEVLAGKHREHFVVDVYQAGAGTSHNMNVNEVLANRANEILGAKRGVYSPVHPNDHVNMAQSTNDVIPTAIRLACLTELGGLEKAFEGLASEFEKKGKEFDDVLKSGRTHLQDATPLTVGQEMSGWANLLERDIERLKMALPGVLDLAIGGNGVPRDGVNEVVGRRQGGVEAGIHGDDGPAGAGVQQRQVAGRTAGVEEGGGGGRVVAEPGAFPRGERFRPLKRTLHAGTACAITSLRRVE